MRRLAHAVRDCNPMIGEHVDRACFDANRTYKAAFFARGAGTRVVSHESCRFKPLYVPLTRRMAPKYRAPTLAVDIKMEQPAAEAMTGTIMW